MIFREDEHGFVWSSHRKDDREDEHGFVSFSHRKDAHEDEHGFVSCSHRKDDVKQFLHPKQRIFSCHYRKSRRISGHQPIAPILLSCV